jgi:transmembrane sensor
MSDLPAREVKATAAEWFERRNFWEWSAENEAAFAEWLNASLAHRAAYVRVEAAWKRTERLTVLKSSVRRPQQPAPRERSRFWFFGAAAATVAVAALAGAIVYWPSAEPETQTYATMVGGRETLALTDGTKIELNTDTQLRTQITVHERKVWLDKGEAYFQVKHDAAHPFVVIAGNHRVTDLGTKFVIRRDAAKMEVALVEGRAQVDALNSKTNAPSVEMVPGDVVIATANRIETQKKPVAALSTGLAWRQGLLIFKRSTLAEAAAQFNRYNREKLVVDGSAAQLKIGGTFQSDNISDFAEVAREVLGVRIAHRGDRTIISRQ